MLLVAEVEGGDAAGPTIDPTQFKGRWVTAAGVTPAVTALVVHNASGTANASLPSQNATRLVKLVVRGDSSANGRSYSLSQSNIGICAPQCLECVLERE